MLQASLESHVQVYTKGLKIVSGKLVAFDQHMNIMVSKAKEHSQAEGSIRNFDFLFIRGDSIILISNEGTV